MNESAKFSAAAGVSFLLLPLIFAVGSCFQEAPEVDHGVGYVRADTIWTSPVKPDGFTLTRYFPGVSRDSCACDIADAIQAAFDYQPPWALYRHFRADYENCRVVAEYGTQSTPPSSEER